MCEKIGNKIEYWVILRRYSKNHKDVVVVILLLFDIIYVYMAVIWWEY